MGELLKKHLKKEIRYQEEDLIVYEPKKEQLDSIRNILSETFTINGELKVKGTIDVVMLKYLIRNLTNIGNEIDNYDEAEIVNLIDNDGDRVLKNIIKELIKIVKEVINDIQTEQYNLLDGMANIVESVEAKIKLENVEKRYDKIINSKNKKKKR